MGGTYSVHPRNRSWLQPGGEHPATKRICGILQVHPELFIGKSNFNWWIFAKSSVQLSLLVDDKTSGVSQPNLWIYWMIMDDYPLVICYIAIENGHRNSGFSHWNWWFSIVMLVYQRVWMIMDEILVRRIIHYWKARSEPTFWADSSHVINPINPQLEH